MATAQPLLTVAASTTLPPLYAISGYLPDEFYRLVDGKAVSKDAWLAPQAPGTSLTYLSDEDIYGMVDMLTTVPYRISAAGYIQLDDTFKVMYDAVIDPPTQKAIVERLRLRRFDPANFTRDANGKFRIVGCWTVGT